MTTTIEDLKNAAIAQWPALKGAEITTSSEAARIRYAYLDAHNSWVNISTDGVTFQARGGMDFPCRSFLATGKTASEACAALAEQIGEPPPTQADGLVKAAIAQWPEIGDLPPDSIAKGVSALKGPYVHFHFENHWIQLYTSVIGMGFNACIGWDDENIAVLSATGKTAAEACAALAGQMEGGAALHGDDLVRAAIVQWPEIKGLPFSKVISSHSKSTSPYAHFHFENYWIQIVASATGKGFSASSYWDENPSGTLSADGNTPAEACAALAGQMGGLPK